MLAKFNAGSLGNVYTQKIFITGRGQYIDDDRSAGDDVYPDGLGD